MVNDEMLDKDLKNKGYCFVEFGDHKSAATAKKKLENTRDLVSMENNYTPRKLCLWEGILFSRCPTERTTERTTVRPNVCP